MPYDREPRYLHPLLQRDLPLIIETIKAKLPQGFKVKLISAHRTPADQFELYKKGRTFSNGEWRKTGSVVTNMDGYNKKSRHNFLPATAFDIGIFNEAGQYVTDHKYYKHVAQGKSFNLDWGGDWQGLVDTPHLELPVGLMFKQSQLKEIGRLWQLYLQLDGTYTGSLDGIFGEKSLKSLKESTQQNEMNMAAWDVLCNRHGLLFN